MWNKLLEEAISKYDFEAMKQALLNGAKIENMILHRVINKDRLDWLKYFLFSPELSEHCDINYEYFMFGEGASFKYACMMGSLKIVKYLATSEKFNFKNIGKTSLIYACSRGDIETVDFLLNSKQTHKYCIIDIDNLDPVKEAALRNRAELIGFLILNIKDIKVVEKIVTEIKNCKEYIDKAFNTRILRDSLIEKTTVIKKINKL
jgi:ankyrin repeat protein